MSRRLSILSSFFIHLIFVLTVMNLEFKQFILNAPLEIGVHEQQKETRAKKQKTTQVNSQVLPLPSPEKTTGQTDDPQNIDSSTTVNPDPSSPIAQSLPTAESEYSQYLYAEISRMKSYPAIAQKMRQTGTVILHLHLLRSGEVKSAKIIQSAKFEPLNQEVQRLIRSLVSFKKFPVEIKKESWDFIIPIEFSLKNNH